MNIKRIFDSCRWGNIEKFYDLVATGRIEVSIPKDCNRDDFKEEVLSYLKSKSYEEETNYDYNIPELKTKFEGDKLVVETIKDSELSDTEYFQAMLKKGDTDDVLLNRVALVLRRMIPERVEMEKINGVDYLYVDGEMVIVENDRIITRANNADRRKEFALVDVGSWVKELV